MGEFDRSEKNKVIAKGLRKLGLSCTRGSRHDTYTSPNTGRKTTLPRHKEIKNSTVKSICEFLLADGYTREEIKKAFKW